MFKKHSPVALFVSISVATFGSQGALAQSGSTAAEGGLALEEIVVTARKREESLQDVPIAVTAFSAEDISNRQVSSLDDIAKFAPGLVFSKSFGRSNERPVVRGLASVLAGTNATVETGVAYFVDGVYYPGDIQTLDMGEVQRVEVIRGPQSALYGRNTYSGAINFITRRPDDQFRASVSGGIDADERAISGRFSGRISDTLTGSFAARYSDFEGQWKNGLTGKTIGGENSVSFNGTLNFTPTDDLELNLRVAHNRDRDDTRPLFFISGGDNNCFPGTRSLGSYNSTSTDNRNQYFCGEVTPRPVFLNDAPVTQPVTLVSGIPTTLRVASTGGVYDTRQGVAFSGVHRDLDLVLASASWDVFGSGYVFTINGGSRADDRKTGADSDHSSVNIIGANINGVQPVATGASSAIDEYRDWSVEAKFESPQDQRFRWSVGAYRFDWEQKQYRIDFVSLNGQDAAQQIFTIENSAVFGAAEFDFTDKLSASLELRRATEQKGQKDFGATATSATVGRANSQEGPQFLIYNSAIRGNDTWKSTTPRFTVDYKLTDDITLFANYAKGYKPGGFNGSVAIVNGRPEDEKFDQEESTNYEVGMKSTWLDRRLVLNVAAFNMDVSSIQLTTPIVVPGATGAVTSISTNQGDGKVKGFEIETRFAATEKLTLGFNYALADTEFTKGCDDFQFQLTSGGGIFNPANPNDPARNFTGRGSCSIAGNEFPLAARHTGSVTADYATPVFGGDYRLYVNTDVSYTSKKWVQVHNLAYTGAATLVGARIGLETDNWRVGLYGRNLTNEDSSPGATRWLHAYLIGIPSGPAATLDPGLPPTSVAAYSLPRGIFGVLRRERQVGIEFNYNF
jgi:outer membrane receptor protein involved in Fe transport